LIGRPYEDDPDTPPAITVSSIPAVGIGHIVDVEAPGDVWVVSQRVDDSALFTMLSADRDDITVTISVWARPRSRPPKASRSRWTTPTACWSVTNTTIYHLGIDRKV